MGAFQQSENPVVSDGTSRQAKRNNGSASSQSFCMSSHFAHLLHQCLMKSLDAPIGLRSIGAGLDMSNVRVSENFFHEC